MDGNTFKKTMKTLKPRLDFQAGFFVGENCHGIKGLTIVLLRYLQPVERQRFHPPQNPAGLTPRGGSIPPSGIKLQQ